MVLGRSGFGIRRRMWRANEAEVWELLGSHAHSEPGVRKGGQCLPAPLTWSTPAALVLPPEPFSFHAIWVSQHDHMKTQCPPLSVTPATSSGEYFSALPVDSASHKIPPCPWYIHHSIKRSWGALKNLIVSFPFDFLLWKISKTQKKETENKNEPKSPSASFKYTVLHVSYWMSLPQPCPQTL